MAIRRSPDEPPPGDGSRSSGALVQLSRYGPIAGAYAVFQSLVGVLPSSFSADTARYALATCAGLAVGVIIWLSTLVRLRGNSPRTGRGAADDEPHPVPAFGPGRLAQLMDGSATALLHCRSAVDDPALGRLVGWPHFLEEGEQGQRATAISTAYGLHITLILDRTNGLLDPPALVDTLWRLRKSDGGWAARTGGVVSRPEVTALVLGALSQAGADPQRLREGLDVLEGMLVPGVDVEGMSRTYVVTAVIRGLLRAAPGSPSLGRLRDELVAGVVRDAEHDDLLCWGYSLDTSSGPARQGPVSVAHTAHAVLALARLEKVLGVDDRARHAMEQGVAWLVRVGTFTHQTEHLRRLHPAHGADHLLVRHFTAALVAKALLGVEPMPAADPPADPADPALALVAQRRAHLAAAVSRVWELQQEGVWEWDDDRQRRPVWMTYQGLSVLAAHAVHSCGPQPYRPSA